MKSKNHAMRQHDFPTIGRRKGVWPPEKVKLEESDKSVLPPKKKT